MKPTKLKVRTLGDPCLRQKSTPLEDVTAGERMLIESMLITMYEEKGIGLAAPQVGINKCLLVVDIGEGPLVVINPQVIKKSGREDLEEGCLSVPGGTVVITRPEKILLRYRDENNVTQERWFEGLWARVLQHEMDHLEGKLIVDYAPSPVKKKIEEMTQDQSKKNNE